MFWNRKRKPSELSQLSNNPSPESREPTSAQGPAVRPQAPDNVESISSFAASILLDPNFAANRPLSNLRQPLTPDLAALRGLVGVTSALNIEKSGVSVSKPNAWQHALAASPIRDQLWAGLASTRLDSYQRSFAHVIAKQPLDFGKLQVAQLARLQNVLTDRSVDVSDE